MLLTIDTLDNVPIKKIYKTKHTYSINSNLKGNTVNISITTK